MKIPLIIFFLITILASCDSLRKEKQADKTVSHINTLELDSPKPKNETIEPEKTISNNLKPVFGYRFIVTGDFNGDGTKEKLMERFVSGVDNKETNKFYDGLSDHGQLVELTLKKDPISFVISNNKHIDTLCISSRGQNLGLSYLRNEGDLNGDGTDEVSYVVNWADWSSLNTWHLVSYKNNKWTEIFSFPIWDWQLPDLPETFDHFSLFGLEQKISHATNDPINRQKEKELMDFKGLVKKIETNKIQVIYRNDQAEEDTMMVDLNQPM